MKVFLTSHLGGSFKLGDERFPCPLMGKNGLVERLKACWTEWSKVLLVAAHPGDHERNDSILSCLKDAFPMSDLSLFQITMAAISSSRMGRPPCTAKPIPYWMAAFALFAGMNRALCCKNTGDWRFWKLSMLP